MAGATRGLSVAGLAFLLMSAPQACPAQENEGGAAEADRHAEAGRVCSILDAWLANAEALRSGDVLVRTRITLEALTNRMGVPHEAGGLIEESEKLVRLAFDHDRDWYCYQEHESVRRTKTGKEDPEPDVSESSRFAAALVNSGHSVIRQHWPGEREEIARKHVSGGQGGVRDFLVLPDFRAFGSTTLFGRGGLELIQEEVNDYRSGDRLIRHGLASNGQLTLVFATGDIWKGGNPGDWGELEYRMDTSAMVPVFRAVRVRFNNRMQPIGSMSFQWQERNGIMVGQKASSEGNVSVRIGSEDVTGRRYAEVVFHWLSVNEPLAEEAFDGSRMASLEAVKKNVDPVLNGVPESWQEPRKPGSPED